MEKTVVINGTTIHIGYIAMNCLWVLLSLIVGGVLFTQVYRLSALSKSTKDRRKYHGLRVQWAHATGVWLCILVAGIDVSFIYFDKSIYLGIFFGELNILVLNMYIFYFFTHVEAYVISNKSLDIPGWLPRTRFYWMIINFIMGNVLNVTMFVLQRLYLAYLVQAWVGVQGVCVAFVLGGVTWHLSQTVARVFGKATTDENSTIDSLRKFKVTSVISVLYGIFYGVTFTATFIVQVTTIDPAIRFPTTREDREDFEFYWVQWTTYVAIIYAIKLFWIPKSVLDAARTSLWQSSGATASASSAGANKSGKANAGGTMSRSRAPDPFASPYQKSLHSASASTRRYPNRVNTLTHSRANTSISISRVNTLTHSRANTSISISRGSAISYIAVRAPRVITVRQSRSDSDSQDGSTDNDDATGAHSSRRGSVPSNRRGSVRSSRRGSTQSCSDSDSQEGSTDDDDADDAGANSSRRGSTSPSSAASVVPSAQPENSHLLSPNNLESV